MKRWWRASTPSFPEKQIPFRFPLRALSSTLSDGARSCTEPSWHCTWCILRLFLWTLTFRSRGIIGADGRRFSLAMKPLGTGRETAGCPNSGGGGGGRAVDCGQPCSASTPSPPRCSNLVIGIDNLSSARDVSLQKALLGVLSVGKKGLVSLWLMISQSTNIEVSAARDMAEIIRFAQRLAGVSFLFAY